MSNRRLAKNQKDQLADDIIQFLFKHELFDDVILYIDNKRIASFKPNNRDVETVTKPFGTYYVEDNVDVKTMIEYNNPNTLTMTFEGALYNVFNGYNDYCEKLKTEFSDILDKYGLYYEQGYAWSLACYFE